MDDLTLEGILDRYGVPIFKRKTAIKCFVPDHDDRVASCSVNLDKDVWHCHACGRGGGPMQALMALEGLTYADAAVFAAANGLGGGDGTVRVQRERLGRVAAGKGYKPKYRRHVPAWKRPA